MGGITLITQKELKDKFHYDLDNGLFTWKVCTKGHRAGMPAGSLDGKGYV
jgi:hypothetical protein